MKKIFEVSQNYQKGRFGPIYKPEDQKARERLTFVTTKQQRALIASYSQKTGITLSDIVRNALSKYFEDIEVDQIK